MASSATLKTAGVLMLVLVAGQLLVATPAAAAARGSLLEVEILPDCNRNTCDRETCIKFCLIPCSGPFSPCTKSCVDKCVRPKGDWGQVEKEETEPSKYTDIYTCLSFLNLCCLYFRYTHQSMQIKSVQSPFPFNYHWVILRALLRDLRNLFL
jgi:hypothetical protein